MTLSQLDLHIAFNQATQQDIDRIRFNNVTLADLADDMGLHRAANRFRKHSHLLSTLCKQNREYRRLFK